MSEATFFHDFCENVSMFDMCRASHRLGRRPEGKPGEFYNGLREEIKEKLRQITSDEAKNVRMDAIWITPDSYYKPCYSRENASAICAEFDKKFKRDIYDNIVC